MNSAVRIGLPEPTMLDAFRQDDVFGFGTLRITSQGSVSTCDPNAHIFIVNDSFDEDFVSDVALALKNLRDRINAAVA